MKGCPKSLGRDIYIDAKRRDDCRKGIKTSPQFRSGPGFGEPQIGRRNKHGLVKGRMPEGKVEIGQSDSLEGISSSRRSACRVPQSDCDLPKTLDCNGRNNRIPVLEM